MDLTKFVWMLQKKALYFCQAGAIGDPFEGHYTELMAKSEDEFARSFFPLDQSASEEEKVRHQEMGRNAFRQMLDHIKRMKRTHYINCWRMNEYDSLAMWKLYTSHGESISVRSTYRKLAQALPQGCFLGRVHYIDYRIGIIDMGNVFNFIMHKRKSFEHERELRAAV
jgi:hypothetical protein